MAFMNAFTLCRCETLLVENHYGKLFTQYRMSIIMFWRFVHAVLVFVFTYREIEY